MDDGDLLVLHVVGDVLAGDAALLVVAAAGAEHVPQLALGDARVGRRRRDHQHAVLDVDLGRRHGDAGIEVADDEMHAFAEEIVGDRDALARIGDVVTDEQLDLLAVDAARGVDVGNGLLDAVLQLGAERRVRAGHGAGNAQLQLLGSTVAAREQGGECDRQCGKGGC